ncbi:MAG: Hsp33 family molecular chaperone HslO [Halioglobus sp.]
MKPTPAPPSDSEGDRSVRFLFDNADVRGETVHLQASLKDLLETHQYAPGVARLLGEFLAAAVLLSTTLKFEGKMILQARSEGQVPLLMAECSSELKLRAIARGAQQATSEEFGTLLARGQLAITIEPDKGQRYQGIVPLVENSLSRSLDAYFLQSEQLYTRFWLTSDGERAAGMLLQQLPAQLQTEEAAREEQWQHLCSLATTLQPAELLGLNAEKLLFRLYHEEPTRVFEPRRPEFSCSCSRQRSLNALIAIGPEEVESVLVEQGSITMDCEFCNQRYAFLREDLETLFKPADDSMLH